MSNGVVSDSQTGLEWYQLGQYINWNQAKSMTEGLTVAGGGWRMPTRAELKALFAGPDGMNPLKQDGMWVWSGELNTPPSSAYAVNSADGTGSLVTLNTKTIWGLAVRSRK